MTTSSKITLACTLLGVGLFTGTPQTHAAPLAYEGFNYTAGNVNGEDGGTGWAAAWNSSTSSANVVTGTPLSYTGGSITVNGSGSALSITGGGEGALNRGFVGTGSGTELYFSFLFQAVAGDGNEFFQFYLSDDADRNNAGTIGDLQTGANDSRFGARISDASTEISNPSVISYTLATTYFLVGRLSTDGAPGAADEFDRVELWVNPTSASLGAANAMADRATGLSIAAFDTFSTRMVGFAGTDQILVDELRIGTDFASVVPEPSVAGLLLLGGMSILALRRRTA